MPGEREWIILDEDGYSSMEDSYTVMCYNVLSDKYATPQTYGYTASWALNWNYRKNLLLQDILNYSADIVCLQEVEGGQYEEFFKEQLARHGDYSGVFWPKSRVRTMTDVEQRKAVDGCATFFKAKK
jgi:CCR4-NOT transcription complex subunit 6